MSENEIFHARWRREKRRSEYKRKPHFPFPGPGRRGDARPMSFGSRRRHRQVIKMVIDGLSSFRKGENERTIFDGAACREGYAILINVRYLQLLRLESILEPSSVGHVSRGILFAPALLPVRNEQLFFFKKSSSSGAKEKSFPNSLLLLFREIKFPPLLPHVH